MGPGTAPNLTILVQSLLDAAPIALADALAARAALAGVGELSSAEARTRAHRRRRALLWSDQFARTMRLQHPFYTHPGSCQHPTAPGSRQRIFSPVILPCCIVRSARSAAARKFSRKFHDAVTSTGHLAATSTDDSRKAIFPHKPAPTTYTWGSVLCQHSNHTPYLTGTHVLPIATSFCSVPRSNTGPQLVVVSIGTQNTKERTSPLLIEGIRL